MPFIRQARDKRGFDHTYVMHVARGPGGQQQTRVLYVFRSPANLQIGRTALDAEVREALEHTHPDLSFDWNALTRDAVTTRSEPSAPRPGRGQRPARSSQRPPSPPPAAAATAPVVPTEDPSTLGQVLGAAEAARLRTRYNELVQRIGRRARSPEERDRLLDRAKRLNPDGWPDEATIRAQAPSMDQECDAVAAELPSRRRGRRGGRRRAEEGGAAASGIMAMGDHAQPGPERSYEETAGTRVDAEGGAAGSGGDAGIGPAGSEADLSGGD